MASTRALPNHADLQPYNFAVAGHDGTLCDPDGELFIKPCTKQEVEFYESAIKEHRDFASLMPVYIGTLALNDATDMKSLNEQLPAAAEHISEEMKQEALRAAKEAAAEAAAAPKDNIKWQPGKNKKIATNTSVVLENAAYGYKRPNILDAKLGRRLWADDAPLEKQQRFDEISKATTNGSHGFRVAGMRVYRGSEDPAEWDSEGYKVYDKDYGRYTVNSENVVSEMGRFIFNSKAGVDEDLGKVIAGAFVEDLKRVEQILAAEESRMYSSSLLFTFEGDGEALRLAIEQSLPASASSESSTTHQQRQQQQRPDEEQDNRKVDIGKHLPGLSASRVDSGIVLDDDGELISGPGDVNEKLSVIGHGGEILIPSTIAEHVKVLEFGTDGPFATPIEMEMDEGYEESEMSTMPRVYSVKLIDFAHAQWVPGQGPDENVLFGVRSLIKIFEELSQ
ncbi:inositol polyphosphate kinase-domain-containing protein [Apodospora peruviana]|uniref:Kinase n=1 Tax=Apodospora peruviana TaxID=516989 RepID=A0AAE0M499_9PEZI|nr:inositol polyphosphate kinase-domain-containing protein [Apodospora peruviana]